MTTRVAIPGWAAWADDVRRSRGAAAERWLRRVPRLVEACAERWDLRLGDALLPSRHNLLLPAQRRDGERVALKLGPPLAERRREAAALRAYDGRGAVRLLDEDAPRGALLLEWVEPGTPLRALVERGDDDAATAAASGVLRALWRPPPDGHRLPTLRSWTRYLRAPAARDGGLPPWLLDRARALAGELLAGAPAPVLLHGDLHQDNVLAADRRPWLAIDPKGLVGEPAADAAALLRNPRGRLLAMPDAGRVLARRVDVLCDELPLERARVTGWAVVLAAVAACWAAEDGDARSVERWARCAELLARVA